MSRFREAWQNLNFDKEYLFGFETLVFAILGILSMHNQLVTLLRRKQNLKSHHMTFKERPVHLAVSFSVCLHGLHHVQKKQTAHKWMTLSIPLCRSFRTVCPIPLEQNIVRKALQTHLLNNVSELFYWGMKSLLNSKIPSITAPASDQQPDSRYTVKKFEMFF